MPEERTVLSALLSAEDARTMEIATPYTVEHSALKIPDRTELEQLGELIERPLDLRPESGIRAVVPH